MSGVDDHALLAGRSSLNIDHYHSTTTCSSTQSMSTPLTVEYALLIFAVVVVLGVYSISSFQPLNMTFQLLNMTFL